MKSKYNYAIDRGEFLRIQVYATTEDFEWGREPLAAILHDGTTVVSTNARTNKPNWKDALEFGKSIVSALLEAEGLK